MPMLVCEAPAEWFVLDVTVGVGTSQPPTTLAESLQAACDFDAAFGV